ncbi:hypothetical protein A5N14_13665 [Arthrobacter sp. M5]|nr:hypothetical protein [Arthrobacter sp. M5]
MVVEMQRFYVFGSQEPEALDRRQNGMVAVTESSFDGTQTTLGGTRGCIRLGASGSTIIRRH